MAINQTTPILLAKPWSSQFDAPQASQLVAASDSGLQITPGYQGTPTVITTIGNLYALANGSTGDVTAVIAGPGLTGGGSAGDVTVAVAQATILSTATTTTPLVNQSLIVSTHPTTRVSFTLPSSVTLGSRFRVAGFGAAGWQITQQAGQSIYFGNQITTVGASGGLASTVFTDGVEIVCVVANTTFLVISSVGNITIS